MAPSRRGPQYRGGSLEPAPQRTSGRAEPGRAAGGGAGARGHVGAGRAGARAAGASASVELSAVLCCCGVRLIPDAGGFQDTAPPEQRSHTVAGILSRTPQPGLRTHPGRGLAPAPPLLTRLGCCQTVPGVIPWSPVSLPGCSFLLLFNCTATLKHSAPQRCVGFRVPELEGLQYSRRPLPLQFRS